MSPKCNRCRRPAQDRASGRGNPMREPAATDEKRSVPCGTGRFFGKPYGWLTRQGLPTLTRRRLRILRQADDLVRGGLHADNSSVEGGGEKKQSCSSPPFSDRISTDTTRPSRFSALTRKAPCARRLRNETSCHESGTAGKTRMIPVWLCKSIPARRQQRRSSPPA